MIIAIRPEKTSNLHAHTKHRLEEGGRRHSEAAKEHSELDQNLKLITSAGAAGGTAAQGQENYLQSLFLKDVSLWMRVMKQPRWSKGSQQVEKCSQHSLRPRRQMDSGF